MTETSTAPETRGFQTEARQLLRLMIHSLYSNREIFLRELISNASDALDKLRFSALDDASLMAEDSELRIRLLVDAEAGTLTIRDNGIGMTRDEAIEHLGTIARSGTAEFLKSLETVKGEESANLIGQFGVGFYSAFIVADEVVVESRRAGAGADEACRWRSRGESEFSIESIERAERGTDVILHLKEDAKEFLERFRIESIVRKYADHLAFPVQMIEPPKPATDEADTGSDEVIVDASGEPVTDESAPVWKTLNEAKALWTRPRSDVSDDEYKAFYRHVSHDYDEPLSWSHNRVEGSLEYTSLLYLPKHAPFDMWQREAPRGLKLYVQRVFIMDDAEQFLPLYLRFVKGIVDSQDLPLNVSREILQNDRQVETIRNALARRVLDMLDKLAEDEDKAKYQAFWDEFGLVLKEGPAEDFANRERIAGLLRFSSTHTDDPRQDQSLADYVARMKPDQERIYYVVGDNHAAAAGSPHIEVFRKRGIEVLLLADRLDEWLMTTLGTFDGKTLTDIAKGDVELPGAEDTDEDTPQADDPLLERIGKALDSVVESVRASRRLVDSPACLVVGEYDMGLQMRRIMEAAGQQMPAGKPILEVNVEHPLLRRLAGTDDEAAFGELAELVFDQAALASGEPLRDSAGFVKRLNRILLDLAPESNAG